MNFMNYPRIVLFDLDGVILNTESVYLDLMLKYNKKINLPISKRFYINNLLGKTKNEITYHLYKKFKTKFKEKEYWDDLFKYREEYLKNNLLEIKDGFVPLFKYLKKRGISIGIVTSNSIILVKQLLLNAGININDFDIIITREDVKSTKPAPDLYLKAIEYLKINKNEVIAIEDSNVGIRSALSAGINVINVKDIDFIENNLRKKCILAEESLNGVLNFFKEMRD